ncbi:MAG: ATP synthase F1 subunit delta [Clostridia bacterium]|nr:ATP synthase F1 subunit delta [Clostridia bacterium]
MTAAKEYATALYELSDECGLTEAVMEDVVLARTLFSENPEYSKLLDTPAVPKEERIALIDEALGELDKNLLSLIKILAEHHATRTFPKVADEYSRIYDTAHGIMRAEIISARPLTDAQLSSLTDRLSKKCGKTVKLTAKVDKSLLGGAKLRYLGIQLDGTVKSRLEAAERKIKELVI